MKKDIGDCQIVLKKGDITKEKVDVIVNAANSSLMGGGGVDGAIHRAGGPEILDECKEIRQKQGGLPAGDAVTTTAGNLEAKYVVHTVGPVWYGGDRRERETLHDAYTNSLKCSLDKEVKSIAFPSISTGAFGYPVAKAAETALLAVKAFLEANKVPKKVYFVLFSDDDLSVYEKALSSL